MASKEKKKKPAGINDKIEVAYANFAADNKKTELKIKGEKFDNKELLRTLGFIEKDGVMTLNTYGNKVVINEAGEVIKREHDGKTLTGERDNSRVI